MRSVKRREFISLLGHCMAGRGACAEERAMPVVGFLHSSSSTAVGTSRLNAVSLNSWSLQVAARRELIMGDGTLHDGGSDPGPPKHYARLRIGLPGLKHKNSSISC